MASPPPSPEAPGVQPQYLEAIYFLSPGPLPPSHLSRPVALPASAPHSVRALQCAAAHLSTSETPDIPAAITLYEAAQIQRPSHAVTTARLPARAVRLLRVAVGRHARTPATRLLAAPLTSRSPDTPCTLSAPADLADRQDVDVINIFCARGGYFLPVQSDGEIHLHVGVANSASSLVFAVGSNANMHDFPPEDSSVPMSNDNDTSPPDAGAVSVQQMDIVHTRARQQDCVVLVGKTPASVDSAGKKALSLNDVIIPTVHQAMTFELADGLRKKPLHAAEICVAIRSDISNEDIFDLAQCFVKGSSHLHIPKDEARALKIFEVGVMRGHVPAMIALADLLHFGNGIGYKKEERKAAHYYQRAISLSGDADAMYKLGRLFVRNAQEKPECVPQAVSIFERAIAEHNHYDSMHFLAWCLIRGFDGVAVDEARAVSLLERAWNEGGRIKSCNSLARLLSQGGRSIPMDKARAVRLYERAIAQANCPLAMCGLAAMLQKGGDGVAVDEIRAASLLERAAAENRRADSIVSSAMILAEGLGLSPRDRDVPAAVLLLTYAIATWGHSPSMRYLSCLLRNSGTGVHVDGAGIAARNVDVISKDNRPHSLHSFGKMLMSGFPGVAKDMARAMRLFERAIAEHSYAKSMTTLANCLVRGAPGVQKDIRRAIELYERAVAQGHVKAMVRLANLLRTDEPGVIKDKARSLSLYEEAVDKGDRSAMANLAIILETGDGIERNISRAVELYERAVRAGPIERMYRLGDLFEKGMDGVGRSAIQAARLYENGVGYIGNTHVHSMVRLGLLLWGGNEGADEDRMKATRLFKKALAQGQGILTWLQLFSFAISVSESYAECGSLRVALLERSAIEDGNLNALELLGTVFSHGMRGVKVDVGKAIEWLERGVEKDHLPCVMQLAKLYHLGRAGKKYAPDHRARAAKLYEIAANKGCPEAMFFFAQMTAYSSVDAPLLRGNLPQAVEWLTILIGQERHYNGNSQFLLAKILEDSNPARAAVLYRDAIDDHNHVRSMLALARICRDEKNPAIGSAEVAVQLYGLAIAKHSSAEAMKWMTIMLEKGWEGDRVSGELIVEWYEAAIARKKRARAALCLASMLRGGIGRVQADGRRALVVLERGLVVAEQRARSKHLLSLMMVAIADILVDAENGVDANTERAVELLERAIEEHECADAMYRLGTFFDSGKNGIAVDKERAVELYKRAIVKEYVPSLLKLAKMYQFGEGVDEDETLAVDMYIRVLKQEKNTEALVHLVMLAVGMRQRKKRQREGQSEGRGSVKRQKITL